MYKLVIEYKDTQLADTVRSAKTFAISSMLTDYEAYGCCVNSNTIVFDEDAQRTIAMLVVGDLPDVSRLRLG